MKDIAIKYNTEMLTEKLRDIHLLNQAVPLSAGLHMKDVFLSRRVSAQIST